MSLRLEGQGLIFLPPGLLKDKQTDLVELSMDENELRTFSVGANVLDNMLFRRLFTLRRLSLRKNALTTLPRAIQNMVCSLYFYQLSFTISCPLSRSFVTWTSVTIASLHYQ